MRKSAAAFFKTTPTRKLVRKSLSRQDLRSLNEKVTLERVFGLTTTNTNGLASNPHTGVIAYPAGCVVVLYDLKTAHQKHIFNPDKKTITCVGFSSDGKYLVTGESGQQPSVRVWELNDQLLQVAELRGHKSGITSVAFSPDQKLIVSIGDQHDMLVNVWNWRLGHTVACNKSGCRVRAFSFSENGNYLVTVGNRHVKFWYLDEASSKSTTSSTTPISGRSGILGDQRNNCFTDVQCGVGKTSQLTFCVTKSGLLCMFSGKRILEKWVELKAGSTNCLAITDRYVFCGCSDGVVRVFEPSTLKFVTTLPKPHAMGVNVTEGITSSDLINANSEKGSPDLVAMTVSEVHNKLTCVYNDHSLYIWDVKDIRKVGKTASFLYHSACIWGVETYPYFEDANDSLLPYNSFLTCSSDDTIRLWNFEKGVPTSKTYPRNLYSKDLLKIVYIDEDLTHLQDTSMAPFGKDPDNKNGVRCMQLSPDGKLLATGDRSGNLRIYDVHIFKESIRIEAHESEILCVEFSSIQSWYQLLASSSRDRLIHIFDVRNQFCLLQTIDDHSSSITAVRFNYDGGTMQLLSCGADKVVMFHTAQFQDGGDIVFVRNTIVPGKATLYDMGIEPTRKYAATVGQDRNLRIYDIQGAKQLQCYKGSVSEEGNLIKFQLDDSGVYAAVSCSDKTIALFDFETGECEAAIYGHSELVTGLKFTPDGKRLISVAGDGCIFIWELPSTFTETIRHRLRELNLPSPTLVADSSKENDELRRKTFVVPSVSSNESFQAGHQIPETASTHKSPLGYRFSVGQLPGWAQKQMGGSDVFNTNKGSSYPLGRWGERNDLLTTVPEHAQKMSSATNLGSQESLVSVSSDRSCFEDNSSENDVIYPESNDDIINVEKTFQVTETLKRVHPRASSNKDSEIQLLQEHTDLNGEIDWLENEIESEHEDDDVIIEPDSEEDTGEALLDHFEKLGTPVANLPTKPSTKINRERSSSIGSNDSESSTTTTNIKRSHRASISAKFLSRSQRARASSASSTMSHADEQRRRLETLKAKFMSSTNTHQTTNNRPSCMTQPPRTPQQRRSIDMSSINVFKSRFGRNTGESNLKKSKMISQSCQNLSISPFSGSIPTSPSHSPKYDPRKSSTPLYPNVNFIDDKKAKRRSANAWTNPSLSPVTSPSPNKNSFFLRSKAKKNLSASDSFTKKQRPRPKSLMLESFSHDEFQNQMRTSQAQSDDESESRRTFVTKDMLSDTTPVKEHRRHDTSTPTKGGSLTPLTPVKSTSEVLAQLATSTENDDSLSAVRVRQVAQEIDAQVRAQMLSKEAQSTHPSTYIRYSVNGQSKTLASTPPERDRPVFPPTQSSNEVTQQTVRSEAENIPDNEDLCLDSKKIDATNNIPPLIEKVSMDECQSAMRSLVQSYSSAQKLLTRVLNEGHSDNQMKLLSVISKTYTAIEQNMSEQVKKVDKTLDMSTKLSPIQDSEVYKELEKSLTNNGANSIEVLSILDKYSNVLVDIITAKVKKRETLIE